ncbi:MAG TPA: hypothetical protein P5102_14945 [Candidatus Competibacteraceae bacterium]|nr:hypothetical protein [Candidatus Competibacteraceae bacterium]
MKDGHHTSILDQDEPEPLYPIDENGRLTGTEEDLRTYRQRFTRFGLSIDAITTRDELGTALNLSAAGFTD